MGRARSTGGSAGWGRATGSCRRGSRRSRSGGSGINAGTLGLLNGGGLDELRLITDYRRPLGDALRPGKWLILRRSATALARSGLMRTGVWPAMGKRYGWRDWLVWMEKYGQPTPIARYSEDSDESSKDVAAEIIRSTGETNGAIAPKSIEVEFAEAKRFGDSGSVHQSEIDHCNAEMSKLVNGSTLTNDNKGSGGASYALGSVHDGVRWEAVQYDAERLETAFEREVSAAFVAYNDLRCAPPRLKIQVVRDLDPMTRVQVASKYKNELGGKVSGQQWRRSSVTRAERRRGRPAGDAAAEHHQADGQVGAGGSSRRG